MTPLIVIVVAALLFYALYRRPNVRFGVKLPWTTVIFEASDQKLESTDRVDILKALPPKQQDAGQLKAG